MPSFLIGLPACRLDLFENLLITENFLLHIATEPNNLGAQHKLTLCGVYRDRRLNLMFNYTGNHAPHLCVYGNPAPLPLLHLGLPDVCVCGGGGWVITDQKPKKALEKEFKTGGIKLRMSTGRKLRNKTL